MLCGSMVERVLISCIEVVSATKIEVKIVFIIITRVSGKCIEIETIVYQFMIIGVGNVCNKFHSFKRSG